MPPEVTVCGDDPVTQREFRGELDRIQAACTEHRGQTRSLIERDKARSDYLAAKAKIRAEVPD